MGVLAAALETLELEDAEEEEELSFSPELEESLYTTLEEDFLAFIQSLFHAVRSLFAGLLCPFSDFV